MEAQFLGMKVQIGYLRAREESDRVRAACGTYLQTGCPISILIAVTWCRKRTNLLPAWEAGSLFPRR
jgi:hypothetical protein